MNNDDPILDAMPPGKEESNKSFLSGVLYALVFYAAGFSLAGISYLNIGHPYIHAPGMHHLILLGTFAGGLGWIIGAGIKALKGLRSPRLRGILVTNTVVVLGFLGFLYNISLCFPDRASAVLRFRKNRYHRFIACNTGFILRDGPMAVELCNPHRSIHLDICNTGGSGCTDRVIDREFSNHPDRRC